METAKGIVVGIPAFMNGPLAALVDQAKAQKAVNDNEVCGLFLFVATDWVPGQGWIGDIVYRAVPNLDFENGKFSLDPVAAAGFMSEAVEARAEVVARICKQHGWDSSTPWDVPVRADAAAQVAAMRADNIQVSAEDERKHIDAAVYEECMDLTEAFSSYANAKGFLSIPPEPLSEPSRLRFGADTPRLSAEQWLMIRGVSVLCGIGHSHPNGSTQLSPEDFLANKTIDQWKSVFQVRFATDGQKTNSSLELPKSVGNWIYALAETEEIREFESSSVRKVLGANSSMVRYDKRGVRGVWTGPF